MASGTLRDLWERKLEDLYSTEQKIINTLPELISASTSNDLREALDHHLQQTKIHVERLGLLRKQAGVGSVPATVGQAGIESVLRAGSDQVKATGADNGVRDAAIIAAAQHVEHYEMAGYGCARAWARQLGDDRAAELLQQTLDEEGEADKRLTELAQGGINENATAGARSEDGRAVHPHLRYVDVDDLTAADRYRDTHIRNRAGDDLGKFEGLLVDSSGRPYYVVVDSGGLFVGRRYVVPIGRAEFRATDRAFVVDLDKDTLKRYPEFHRDSFLSMNDEEARRYEWRVLEAVDPQAARSSVRGWNYDQYPYYREPEWFDRGSVAARHSAGPSSTASRSREKSHEGTGTRERVVAKEEIDVIEQRPGDRDRVRGRGSDER